MHPIQWSAKQRPWIHDFHDVAWHARAVRASLEGHAGWAREPARRSRSGAAFLTNGIVEAMEADGIEVDLTLELAASWARQAVHGPTSIDATAVCVLAIETDHHECEEASRVRRVFEPVPNHLLAGLLRFVDPLKVAPNLASA
jgi:hypothetical protein